MSVNSVQLCVTVDNKEEVPAGRGHVAKSPCTDRP